MKKRNKKYANQAIKKKNTKRKFSVLKYKKILISIVALLAVSASVIFVQAASDKIPYYESKNKLQIQNLVPGEVEFLRVDKTSGVITLSDYRYPTLYDGKIGGTSTRHKSNSSFKVSLTDKTITAYKGTPFYHIVPYRSRNTARNLIEPSDLTESEIKNVFKGNPDYVLDNIETYEVRQDGKSLGDFYYIADIARLTGGFVEQTTEIDDINSTRLRWLVTDYPDINHFRTSKTNFQVGDNVPLQFDGWEYTYGKNEFSFLIEFAKDGKKLNNKFEGYGTTTKGQISTLALNQDRSHTGSFAFEADTFKPEEAGTYTATLTVYDGVMRSDTKSLNFTVSENGKCVRSLRVEPPELHVKVGEIGQYRAILINEDCTETDVTEHPKTTWKAEDPTIAESLGKGAFKGLKKGVVNVTATYDESKDISVTGIAYNHN